MTRNNARRLATLGLCCGVVGVAGGQPPPLPTSGGEASPPSLSVPSIPIENVQNSVVRIPSVETTNPGAAPNETNFDNLLADLLAVRAQKAELEKREKAITEALLKKFNEQKAQLEKLGIDAPTALPVPAISK